MRKLTLDPEKLVVESFTPVADAASLRGTVDAHSFVTVNNLPCSEEPSTQCEHSEVPGTSCINYCHYSGDECLQ